MVENILKNSYSYGQIRIFSIGHILIVLITLLLCIYIVKKRKRLSSLTPKKVQNIRIILATVLIINLFLRRGSYIFFDYYDWHYNLDINFCNFTSILFLIYLLTSNKKIYNYCYYMVFIGSLLSIILPSGNLYISNYSFYSFLIIHHILFICNLVFMYIEKKKYSKKDFISVHIFLIIYFIIIFLFDFITKTTYNNPLTFVNANLLNNSVISFLCKYSCVPYIIMFLFIEFLLQFGKAILIKYNFSK